MRKLNTFLSVITLFCFAGAFAQQISEFTSVEPLNQSTDLVIPSTHNFQYIIQHADPLTAGGNMPDEHDFSGYVPIEGSSTNGYLSINSERFPGGVTVLDINLDNTDQKWIVTASEKVDFTPVVRTAYNCSGAVTEWGTVISCEEVVAYDGDNDGYKDFGWNVEVDPITKTVIDKLWAMGNFAHENVAIHPNKRTVYQGADSDPGYIFKYVADVAEDLSSGKLYVYKGSKNGSGDWILLANTTKTERNSTLQQCAQVGATVFKGVEDLEIGPDGKIYAAVSDECVVYRFDDSDPLTGTTVSNFETYVGGKNYDIDYGTGVISEPWGCGNDNLAFDGDGNLWVLQDGDKNYMWVVKNGHTQTDPLVELFGISPLGSEPTGITFTPDYKYMFMSVMHPVSSNTATIQQDAFGKNVGFGKDITIAIARNENFGACDLTVMATSDYNGYNVSCANGSDGTAEAFPTGGTGPYTYLWDDDAGQTTKIATGLAAGTYSVTVADATGCMTSGNATLTSPEPLTVDAGNDQTVYFGYPPAECVTLMATGQGGVLPYNYTWNTGETTESIMVCPETTQEYLVTITDKNGCEYSDKVMVCSVDVRCGKKLNKVLVCHSDKLDPGNPHTICISKDAVPDHLAHGDELGYCGLMPCDEKMSQTAQIEMPSSTGITPFITNEDWKVYPNPAISNTSVDLTKLFGYEVQLTIYDASGKAFYSYPAKVLDTPVLEINTNSIPAGIYHIVLRTEAQSIVKKLVITK